MVTIADLKIFISALVAQVPILEPKALISALANQPPAVAIAQDFSASKLLRELKLARNNSQDDALLKLEQQGNQVFYQGQLIGKIQLLYKSPLPGELQARLAIESAIERFLEYLQKLYQIVVLDESDYHVQVFIPSTQEPVFSQYWQDFLNNVVFSIYGKPEYELPGLAQTFIIMLNTVTLAGRGFSTLEVPILTQAQSDVLAAWYLAVVREVEKRQIERQKQIDALKKELSQANLGNKERLYKEKDLQKKEEMQLKEETKYKESFQKSFRQLLENQQALLQEIQLIQAKIKDSKIAKSQLNKLHKQQDKLITQILFDFDSIQKSYESVQQKLSLIKESKDDPFDFIRLDRKQNPDKFQEIAEISQLFDKIGTDQINSTRGDIFTQCILEMYRLLENKPSDPLPEPLLSEQPRMMEARSPGDDSKEFCYSCGVAIDPKTAKWKVARFMFERPSQRRQSSPSEDRPYICASCSALSFASSLKITDESIIVKLKSANSQKDAAKFNLKNYLRMLTTGQLNIHAGKYVLLRSDRTGSNDLASEKLGQVQYALAKIASIFPVEVLADFKFYLFSQGSQEILLHSRHLVFIKGLMECYGQTIIVSGKEINLKLGDAVRYVEQDLPFLANYCVTRLTNKNNILKLEMAHEIYWKLLKQDMNNSKQIAKRAKLYRDVSALTGLTYAFVQSLESTAKKAMKSEDAEREMSKIIEKVDDAVAFCYYATLGDKEKKIVQARLYRNRDNYFVYEQTKRLLEEELKISGREEKDESKQEVWLTLYADDVMNAYTYFAENGYGQDREWNELTYNLNLSLSTRFPELVRKLKSTSEKSS